MISSFEATDHLFNPYFKCRLSVKRKGKKRHGCELCDTTLVIIYETSTQISNTVKYIYC